MIVSYIFPKMIFIDDEKTLNFVKEQFKDYSVKNLCVGDWFNTIRQSTKTYVVVPMDTFETVAKKLNINVEDLKQKALTKRLYVGQKIEL